MPFMPLSNYLQIIERAWLGQDGKKVGTFISLKHEHASYANYCLENPDGLVKRFLPSPIDELVILHLKCLHAISKEGYMEAYNIQSQLIQSIVKILQSQSEENWSLPIMYKICQDLRFLAEQVEKTRTGIKEKSGEILEKAAESLMACFRVCAADNRSSDETTKRMGMLTLINQLFRVYFRINKLHLCKPLIRAIQSSPLSENFSQSQKVTFKYFAGRKAMFDSDYKTAEEYLSYAFENCYAKSKKNKRLILIYLVPVKMLLGYLPKKSVLEKYDVLQFWDLAQAVCKGNLRDFDELMIQHEKFFVNCGIYLIIDSLKIIAYRNIFRKVYLMLNTHLIPIETLQAVLVYLGQEGVDIIETECIVASLIKADKIKGYISHQHKKVVVSKQNPFPPLISLS